MKVLSAILAGGKGSRMGHVNKAQQIYKNKKLIDHVLTKIKHHPHIAINIRQDDQNYYSYPTFYDQYEGFQGPLAGIEAALSYAKKESFDAVLSLACDCPYYPEDLMEKILAATTQENHIVMVKSYEKLHPVISLWPIERLDDLRIYLSSGQKKIDRFIYHFPYKIVDFTPSDHHHTDPFTNINSL